jgi:transcription elongation factor
MAAVPMLAGVGMMVVCSSSLAAVMMMGGEEETPATTTPTGPAAPTIPSGQYVKLVHTVAQDNSAEGNADDKNKILNLAELEVFAKGGTTSLAAGKTVTGTALAANYPGANLVDGNMTNFAHTWGRDATVKDEFTVDLGSVQEIEKIKITNRVDCCKNRAIGIKAVILGADGTTVVKETPAISTAADTYTFTFPGTAWA